MAVVHMAACMAVPPPARPPALPSRTFVLVLVLVLVLGDSAIGDANGALGRGRFWATAPPPSAPFRFPNPSCSRIEETRHANASTTAGRQNPNFDRLVRQLQGGAKTERDLKRILKQLGLSWQGMMTSKRAVELKLQSLNFPSYFAFVPTAEDMKLSPRAFHRKMCSGQEVAGHAGFYVMVQYSVSQLCNELQKLESWSAADP